MPTCGECGLLVKNNVGMYVCGGKQNLCFEGKITPETDAKTCIRFSRKEPEKPESDN